MEALFDTSEVLALFPAPALPPPRLFPVPGGNAPADAAGPLGKDALLRGLGSPLLHTLVALQLRLSPVFVGYIYPASMTSFAIAWAVTAAYIPRSGIALFAQTQFAVGVTFYTFYLAWIVWGSLSGLMARGRYLAKSDSDLSRHPHAVLARWAELVKQEKGADGGHLGLLRHLDGDDACPCGRNSCAGRIAGRSGLLRLVDVVVRMALVASVALFGGYTQIITLRLFTWFTAVPATFASLFVLASLAMVLFSGVSLVSASLPALELSRRLHVRAVSDAVSAVLARHYAALWGPERDAAEATLRGSEPYQELCDRLSAYRASRFTVLGVSWYSFVGLVVSPVLAMIANIVAGSCIPAVHPATLCYFGYFFVRELLAVAAANAQVSGTATVLRRAAREANALLARAAAEGLSDTRAARSLDYHMGLLEKYACDQSGAKVLSVEADWGSARAILIAVFTVLVGLWSVLRSSGVYLTPELACPL